MEEISHDQDTYELFENAMEHTQGVFIPSKIYEQAIILISIALSPTQVEAVLFTSYCLWKNAQTHQKSRANSNGLWIKYARLDIPSCRAQGFIARSRSRAAVESMIRSLSLCVYEFICKTGSESTVSEKTSLGSTSNSRSNAREAKAYPYHIHHSPWPLKWIIHLPK